MILEPGKYYVGELIHVVNEYNWKKVTDVAFKDNVVVDGTYTFQDDIKYHIIGLPYPFVSGTLYDNNGHGYGFVRGNFVCMKYEHFQRFDVSHENDSGMGRWDETKIQICDERNLGQNLSELYSQIHNFHSPFNFEIIKGSRTEPPEIQVGHLKLTTIPPLKS